MRIAIYSRKSVDTGKGESIENQIGMCRDYIMTRITGADSAEIVVYEDEGFSGKSMARPRFQQMLRDSRQTGFNFIVCYRLDRISRSVSDFSALIEELNSRKIAFVCIKEQFDTSTPMGRAMMYIASVFAQLERETIAERVRDNMLMLARGGRWLGGSPPTGYTSEKLEECKLDGKRKASCKLKTDPVEIQTVKIIFDKYLELQSLSGVSKYLISLGVKSRNGKPFSIAGIKDILRNPVYSTADKTVRDYFILLDSDVSFSEEQCSDQYGLLSYNKRDASRKGKPRLEQNQWIIAIGRHKGIVSGSDWVRVQRILTENRPNRVGEPKSHNEYALLSGRIFCTICGSRMFSKRRSNSGVLFDYICASKLQSGGLCSCQNLCGEQTDHTICKTLIDRIGGQADIRNLLEVLKRKIALQEDQTPCMQLEKKIQETQKELDGAAKALANANGKASVIGLMETHITRLTEELAELNLRRSQFAERHSLKDQQDVRVDLLSDMLSSFEQSFPQLTIHEKREFIHMFVSKITWDGKDLHVFLR